MRPCSNPACRKLVDQAFGTVKAGDWNEMYEGTRASKDVRELCEKCGTWMVLYCPAESCSIQQMLYIALGWGPQRLLPAPAP